MFWSTLAWLLLLWLLPAPCGEHSVGMAPRRRCGQTIAFLQRARRARLGHHGIRTQPLQRRRRENVTERQALGASVCAISITTMLWKRWPTILHGGSWRLPRARSAVVIPSKLVLI